MISVFLFSREERISPWNKWYEGVSRKKSLLNARVNLIFYVLILIISFFQEKFS